MREPDWINVSDGKTWAVPPTWPTAKYVDARSFSIGYRKEIIHDIHSAKPTIVKALCGAEGYALGYPGGEAAIWRDPLPNCRECKDR